MVFHITYSLKRCTCSILYQLCNKIYTMAVLDIIRYDRSTKTHPISLLDVKCLTWVLDFLKSKHSSYVKRWCVTHCPALKFYWTFIHENTCCEVCNNSLCHFGFVFGTTSCCCCIFVRELVLPMVLYYFSSPFSTFRKSGTPWYHFLIRISLM